MRDWMMYDFNSKPKTMHFKFTRHWEDKWSLIFLICIPFIEITRCLLQKYGTPKTFKAMQKVIYERLLPPMSNANNLNNLCPDLTVYQKFMAPFNNPFDLCKRKRENGHVMERVDLLADYSRKSTNDVVLDLGGNNVSTNQKMENQKQKTSKLDLTSLNTYDIYKVVATFTMFIDHYGYFGLPGLNSRQSRWFRIIGRSAAPPFFFLCGYSSKRFRMRSWCAAVFTYVFTSVVPLGWVHSPWESVLNIALINCIYYYIPPHRIQNWIVHLLIFFVLQYWRNYASSACNIGYGTIPFMLSIAGDLMKHKHYLRYLWIGAGVFSFGYSSNAVFAANQKHTICIIMECIINAVIMSFFTIIEVPFLNEVKITQIARDGLIWVSRTGLLVYIGHLVMFKLISMTYYAGNFNHMMY